MGVRPERRAAPPVPMGFFPTPVGPDYVFVTTGPNVGHWVLASTLIPPLGTPEKTICAAPVQNTLPNPLRAGGRILNVSAYPAAFGLLVRQVRFFATIECTAFVAHVQLWNTTRGELVTGTHFNTANNFPTEFNVAVVVGVAAGNLVNGDTYEAQVWLVGGGGADVAICENARLEIGYV